MFHAGVGKCIEGNDIDLLEVMKKVKMTMPLDCDLFFGHDYGLKNLYWALAYVEGFQGTRVFKYNRNPVYEYYINAVIQKQKR